MRRDPFTVGKIKQRAKIVVSDDGTARLQSLPALGRRLTQEEVDSLAHDAAIPLANRDALEQGLSLFVDHYYRRRRSAEQAAPNNQAEALRQFAEAMDASIYSLPPSLQLEIERRRPGCTAQVRACINEAQALGDQYEKRASRARTIQQAKHLRDNLARSLKGLVMELSPLLSKDAGAAEEWVASVLDWLSIKFPARETDSAAFAAMFGREGQRAQEHAEAQVAHAVRFAAAAKEEASKVRSAQLARWCEMEIERRTEEMIQREIARQRERLAAD